MTAEKRTYRPPGLVVDLFAGPRGWSQGLRMLGLSDVGIEWDDAACRTAMAAGHRATIRADVSRFPTERMRGKVQGLIASAPCTPFTVAGHGAGRHVTAILSSALVATMRGRNVVAASRTEAARVLKAQASRSRATLPRAERSAWARQQAFTSCLVLEVARFARDLHPEWIACEQVPAVLPLWRTLAHELRAHGYSAWVGVLNAADYGVPQTRQRAFLIASRTRPVTAPTPTHCKGGSEPDLFGDELAPWVTMADALGWGMSARPSVTVTAGGGRQGGPDPLDGGSGARETLRREQHRGAWVLRRPATTVTGDPRLSPPNHHGPGEQVGQAVSTESVRAWWEDRPATTVVGSFSPETIAAPGYRTTTSRQNAEGSVKVTLAEAGILQSFPSDYPWQGSKSKQFEQVGNAVPPLLAAHVLSSATGIPPAEDVAA